MNSTPPETAAPATEPTRQPARQRVTDYDRLVDDLAYYTKAPSPATPSPKLLPTSALPWNQPRPSRTLCQSWSHDSPGATRRGRPS